MPGGRPTDYTPELAKRICTSAAAGKSGTAIAKEEGFNVSSLWLWLRTYPEFSADYARAKEDLAERQARR